MANSMKPPRATSTCAAALTRSSRPARRPDFGNHETPKIHQKRNQLHNLSCASCISCLKKFSPHAFNSRNCYPRGPGLCRHGRHRRHPDGGWRGWHLPRPQIGRASCRERVKISVVAVSLKKNGKRGLVPVSLLLVTMVGALTEVLVLCL